MPWSCRTRTCFEDFLTKDLVKQDGTCFLLFVALARKGGESRGQSHSAKILIIVSSLTQLKSKNHLACCEKFPGLHSLYYQLWLHLSGWQPSSHSPGDTDLTCHCSIRPEYLHLRAHCSESNAQKDTKY